MKKVKCILLIDDSDWDNAFNQLIIKEADVCDHIKIVKNGIEGLEYLKKSGDNVYTDLYPKPEVIFLDMNMPKMNGFEFLEQYQNLDKKIKAKLLVIMLGTPLTNDDNEKVQKYEEVNEFEGKPLSVQKVKEIIEKHF